MAGNGNQIATISTASTQVTVDELYGVREETTWLNVVGWGDNAQLVRGRLHKGDHVTLVGKLSIRKAEQGAGEGAQTRYFTQLVLDSFQKNDRANTKCQSGAGNGAAQGSHLPLRKLSPTALITRYRRKWALGRKSPCRLAVNYKSGRVVEELLPGLNKAS
jgi:single-stranded DNA-binding protein